MPSLKSLFLSVVLLAGVQAVGAQVVLTIDISDPTQVVITGTGALAGANAGGVSTTFPIWLTNFLTEDSAGAAPTFTALSASTLATTGSSHTLGSALVRFIPGQRTLVLRESGPSSETFLTTAPAFVGQAAFNFSSLQTVLRGAGWSGDVLAYNGSTTTLIGTYVLTTTAVPEPASAALVGAMAGLGFALVRRRRHAA